ncbi:GH116 family glycosyl-hydrolase [Arenibacter certesii]|uniref:Glycosyl-hydrolase family 116 catalytic region domain-containing protein n=1 Tax=Arenibacter certesii TaxID=228955 RepID=A0A918MQV3_9FLAO|nr:GH116 family glycosyl-hydrolase [Arenibacter certesii]GGW45803.1 hypothetical protein GCM10007383_32620 [Arenibacter certesii]
MSQKLFFLIVIGALSISLQAQVAEELKVKSVINNTLENKDALLKDYYKLSNEAGLLTRGSQTVYKDENLTAIQFPVGGIGTGSIQYDGQAVPRYWQIFNNMGHDFIPNSFFAIRTKQKQKIKVRALQTKEVGSFKPMKSLEAIGRFPFLEYIFDDDLPVKVTMEIFNPFIPTNSKESGIPAVFYEFTINNISSDKVSVNLLASQQNAVGFSKLPLVNHEKSFADNFNYSISRRPVTGNNFEYYKGNTNSIVSEKGAEILLMEGNDPSDSEHFGEMAMVVFDKEGTTKGIASWNNEIELYSIFEKFGKLKGDLIAKSSDEGSTFTGALNTSLTLKPGEVRTVKMALVWYFPNGRNGGKADKWDAWGNGDWEGDGNFYANHWKSIKELTNYLKENHEILTRRTRNFTNSFFETNLPYWLVERISNQLAILKSRTIFHDKNGYVGLWEGTGGVDGSCSGNCNHVWHYAQSHARLFPELGRSIRNQTFNSIKENGEIPYRQPAGSVAFDGQCGDILGAYREHLLSPDNTWLKSQYPAIKKAMNYLVNGYDEDKDGWLSDTAKHTTYDASMSGNPSFLSSLYLAALRASEKMAIIMGDNNQAEEWKNIADNSAKLQSEKLWNGEYFYQIPGAIRATDYENACHSDQLLGQWWADQLALGSLYPDYKIKSANEAILKYNFKSNLKNHDQGHRTFALPEEAGMVVSTWPNKDRTEYASGYSSEVWSTFEYTIGASLIKYNKIRDALTILRSGYNRYDGKLRTGYIGDWGNFGFSGNPFGDDECGQFYGRALSIWSVLLNAQGFEYNGPEQIIGFDPKWKPENHTSFFSTAEGWGNFSQNRDGSTQINTITLKYGKLNLSQIILTLEREIQDEVSVTINGEDIKVTSKNKAGKLSIEFETLNLVAGDIITIKI